MLARTDMYNFYSSGDEVLEIGPQGITVLDWDTSVRQYTWHKQEAFKGRNVLYGTGWAGWGFESNVTAQAVNAASPETLRDFPIFEHDPDEMFSAAITTNMQNRILAKGIPALSKPVGREPLYSSVYVPYDMNRIPSSDYPNGISRPNGWCRGDYSDSMPWLHSDIQNTAFSFTFRLFEKIADKGGVQ